MNEQRTCCECGKSVAKLHTWAEIDPRTNKTVYMCDGCYTSHQNKRRPVIMSVRFIERCTTLDMLEIANNVYAYRITYHMFDDHVQNEPDYNSFALSWVRGAFRSMNHVYDDLSVCATETYMDCDICNQ